MAKAATRATAKKAPTRKAAASKAVSAKAAGAKRPTKAAAPKASAKAAPKVAKKSAGTSGGAILTLRHIAEQLSEVHELPKRQANEMLTQVIAKSLKKGDKIRLSGLGILQVRKRAARTGRNPQTGEPIKIKASKKIAFRPAKELKEAV